LWHPTTTNVKSDYTKVYWKPGYLPKPLNPIRINGRTLHTRQAPGSIDHSVIWVLREHKISKRHYHVGRKPGSRTELEMSAGVGTAVDKTDLSCIEGMHIYQCDMVWMPPSKLMLRLY
jgi:hypothetical protein